MEMKFASGIDSKVAAGIAHGVIMSLYKSGGQASVVGFLSAMIKTDAGIHNKMVFPSVLASVMVVSEGAREVAISKGSDPSDTGPEFFEAIRSFRIALTKVVDALGLDAASKAEYIRILERVATTPCSAILQQAYDEASQVASALGT